MLYALHTELNFLFRLEFNQNYSIVQVFVSGGSENSRCFTIAFFLRYRLFVVFMRIHIKPFWAFLPNLFGKEKASTVTLASDFYKNFEDFFFCCYHELKSAAECCVASRCWWKGSPNFLTSVFFRPVSYSEKKSAH